jgi:hypothetical protein
MFAELLIARKEPQIIEKIEERAFILFQQPARPSGVLRWMQCSQHHNQAGA